MTGLRAFGVVAIVLVVGIGTVSWAYIEQFGVTPSTDQAVWGAFGDYFAGLLNPLISFFAFLALLYTIKIQSMELKQSTKQLEKSAEALESQSLHWEKQNFESTFFHLFALYRELVASLEVSVVNKPVTYGQSEEVVTYTGRYAIDELANGLAKLVSNLTTNLQGNSLDNDEVRAIVEESRINYFKRGRKDFLKKYNDHSLNFLNALESLLTFISQSAIKEESKALYRDIISSQLTRSELFIVFYEALFSKFSTDDVEKRGELHPLLADFDDERIPKVDKQFLSYFAHHRRQ